MIFEIRRHLATHDVVQRTFAQVYFVHISYILPEIRKLRTTNMYLIKHWTTLLDGTSSGRTIYDDTNIRWSTFTVRCYTFMWFQHHVFPIYIKSNLCITPANSGLNLSNCLIGRECRALQFTISYHIEHTRTHARAHTHTCWILLMENRLKTNNSLELLNNDTEKVYQALPCIN